MKELQLSSAQEEVWKRVEAYMLLFKEGDKEGILDFWHNEYTGWPPNSSKPADRCGSVSSLEDFIKDIKILSYELEPQSIVIKDNIAVVHYFAVLDMETSKGLRATRRLGVAHTWLKEGKEWKVFSAMSNAGTVVTKSKPKARIINKESTNSLKGKVALITGGNSGIGKATALAFAQQGVNVSICARRKKEGEEVVKMIKEAGGEAIFIKVDVTRKEEIDAAIDRTIETFGSLDFAFNNAGISGKQTALHRCTDENWRNIMEINLTGVFYCMRSEISYMLDHDGGVVVNMSSMGGLVGNPAGVGAYGASKHGVIGLTRNAALEYAQQNIRVNAVCPAIIQTPLVDDLSENVKNQIAAMHPIGRIGTPEEVAGMVVFLCSDEASFMTGLAVPIDGGFYAA